MFSAKDILNLIQEFRTRGCSGIAAFLEFMMQLNANQRAEIFQVMLNHQFHLDHSKLIDPFVVFLVIFDQHKDKVLFFDEGLEEINEICQMYALQWESTGHTIQ